MLLTVAPGAHVMLPSNGYADLIPSMCVKARESESKGERERARAREERDSQVVAHVGQAIAACNATIIVSAWRIVDREGGGWWWGRHTVRQDNTTQ